MTYPILYNIAAKVILIVLGPTEAIILKIQLQTNQPILTYLKSHLLSKQQAILDIYYIVSP